MWEIIGPILLCLWIITMIVMYIVIKKNGVYEKTLVLSLDKANQKERHCWIKDGIAYVADDKMYCRYDGKNFYEVRPGW